MKEFEPSKDFVARVMRSVRDYEQARTAASSLYDRLLASRPFRYAMSAGSVLAGVFFIPAKCM